MGLMKKKELKKIIVGAVLAITLSAIFFGGASQVIKAVEIGKKQSVQTNYDTNANETIQDSIPLGYVKQDYEVKNVGKHQSTENDMKMEEAAELASQSFWRTFQVNLRDKTLEMNYEPVSKMQSRATWEATVRINENLSYHYSFDAITGESYWVEKRAYHEADIREGLNKELLKNHEEYIQIAKQLTEEIQILPGKITEIDYISQGYDENELNNKNSNITFHVKSENGQKVQVTISTYNQELLSIGYDGWIEEAERLESMLEEDGDAESIQFKITEELLKEVEETDTPIIMNE